MAWVRCGVCALIVMGLRLSAVGQAAAVPVTVEDALHGMSDLADVVFVGQVVAIRTVKAVGAASGVVEVEFRVQRAVRGCQVGTYVMREWAGLWAVNEPRFKAGQRLLMLLHAPGEGGLSSPVGGLDGAIPVRGVGSAVRPQGSSGVFSAAGSVADLRWVGARTLRTVGYSASQVGQVGAETVVPDGAGSASVPTQSASVDVVVGMLSSWGGARHVAQ